MKIQQLPYQTTEIDFQIPTLGQYPVPLDSWDHLNLTHYRYDVKQILVLEDARTVGRGNRYSLIFIKLAKVFHIPVDALTYLQLSIHRLYPWQHLG